MVMVEEWDIQRGATMVVVVGEEEGEWPAATVYEWAVGVLLLVLFYFLVKGAAEATPGMLGPAGLPLVVLSLVLVVQFLSGTDIRGDALSGAFSAAGCPDTSFYRVARSPVGLLLLLLLLVLLICVRASLPIVGNDS